MFCREKLQVPRLELQESVDADGIANARADEVRDDADADGLGQADGVVVLEREQLDHHGEIDEPMGELFLDGIGCVTCSTLAASVMFCSRATARKYEKVRSSMRIRLSSFLRLCLHSTRQRRFLEPILYEKCILIAKA